MSLFARLFRLVWGGEVDRALRPVIAVTLVTSTALSAGWVFTGIWAIDELGATTRQLGTAFLVAAVLSLGAGYLGGHLSDHVGRRPLILLGSAILTAGFFSYIFVDGHVILGLALMAVASAGGSIGAGADTALVADLVPPERHEAGYASTRVASNLGVVFGPVIGSVLLIGRHWPVLFAGITVMGAISIALAYRFLPRHGAYAPEEPPARGSFRAIRRDSVFLVFLVSSAFAYFVYIAYETVLPVSAVKVHGLSPSQWGLIVIVNPVLVTLFQLRVTRWASGYQRGAKFVTAMLMMGGSFLLLLIDDSMAMFLLVMAVFVVGEMLWVPTSQAIAAELAPEDIRGAYMGAFNSTGGVGFALGPFIGLQLLNVPDDDGSAWYFFAAVSVAAAAAGALAVRGAASRRRTAPAIA